MKLVLTLVVAVLAIFPGSARGQVLFRDDFSGPAGARPNPATWRPLDCTGLTWGAQCAESHARLDGVGSLALKVTPTTGAFVGTFAYGTGWPPTGGVSVSWSVPFTFTVKLKMPTTTGVWTVVWPMNVNRTLAQGIWELDVAEPRSALPTQGACFQHYYTTSGKSYTGGKVEIGGAGQWHVYRVRATAEGTRYTVDGKTCMLAAGVRGRFGLLLTSLAGQTGSWQANYGLGMPSGSTAYSRIAYVEVTR